jgi:hypothetical protein
MCCCWCQMVGQLQSDGLMYIWIQIAGGIMLLGITEKWGIGNSCRLVIAQGRTIILKVPSQSPPLGWGLGVFGKGPFFSSLLCICQIVSIFSQDCWKCQSLFCWSLMSNSFWKCQFLFCWSMMSNSFWKCQSVSCWSMMCAGQAMKESWGWWDCGCLW